MASTACRSSSIVLCLAGCARAEDIETKPAFREAFQRRRCLVALDNFYEWKRTATGKQPYAIALADRRPMAMAGLWETWRSPAGERIRSFTIRSRTFRARLNSGTDSPVEGRGFEPPVPLPNESVSGGPRG
jgi:SOS response associated peptidase (SRAP)